MTLEEQVQKLTAERDAARAERDLNIDEHAVKRARLEAERDAALKCVAEMRDVLKICEYSGGASSEISRDNFICPICHRYGPDLENIPHWSKCTLKHALSSDCGKGYHHDDEWRPVVEALEKVRGFGSSDMGHQNMCDYVTEAAEEALAHAERLTGKGEAK